MILLPNSNYTQNQNMVGSFSLSHIKVGFFLVISTVYIHFFSFQKQIKDKKKKIKKERNFGVLIFMDVLGFFCWLQLDTSVLPQWLGALLTEKFFNACIIHEDARKNEKNVFCLDCCEGICPHCLAPHASHRLLQIRRYVYHDVLRLGDAEKLMDCDFVQSYTTNQAKVVFLNQRPQTKTIRGSNNICIICERALQERYLFCSLSCKLQHILRTGDKLSKYVYECESITLHEPGLDDGQMTPDTVLEPTGSMRTESGSSGSGSGSGTTAGGVGCRTLGCTATTEIVKKKRSNVSGSRPACGPVLEISNRRKGAPHRSPLY